MNQPASASRSKASFAIAAEFRSRIASGELRCGEALPVEHHLVAEFGVSKGVVREALRILETEGLMEVRRGIGGGPRVRHPSISEAAKGMGIYLQIGDVPVTDVWETRDRVIGGAVERLAAAGGRSGFDELVVGVAALDTAVGDFDAYYPELLDVGETAVRVAGSVTEQVIVASLRHVIAAELAEATAAIGNVEQAVAAEATIVRAWADTLVHIRAGRVRAARRAYDLQADLVRRGLWDTMANLTVGDVIGS